MRWIDGSNGDSTRNRLTPSLVVVAAVVCRARRHGSHARAPRQRPRMRATVIARPRRRRRRRARAQRCVWKHIQPKNVTINAPDQSRSGTNASNDLHICIHAHSTPPTPVRHDASKRAHASMYVPTRSVFVCTHMRPIVTRPTHPAFPRRTFRGAW